MKPLLLVMILTVSLVVLRTEVLGPGNQQIVHMVTLLLGKSMLVRVLELYLQICTCMLLRT